MTGGNMLVGHDIDDGDDDDIDDDDNDLGTVSQLSGAVEVHTAALDAL